MKKNFACMVVLCGVMACSGVRAADEGISPVLQKLPAAPLKAQWHPASFGVNVAWLTGNEFSSEPVVGLELGYSYRWSHFWDLMTTFEWYSIEEDEDNAKGGVPIGVAMMPLSFTFRYSDITGDGFWHLGGGVSLVFFDGDDFDMTFGARATAGYSAVLTTGLLGTIEVKGTYINEKDNWAQNVHNLSFIGIGISGTYNF